MAGRPPPDFSTYVVEQVVRGLGHNVLIAAARRAGLRVTVQSPDPAVFTLKSKKRSVVIARLELGLNTPLAHAICHRKDLTRFFLARAGLPVPAGRLLRLVEGSNVVAEAAALRFPLVLKPPDGSSGRLVYPEVRSRGDLRARFTVYHELGVKEVVAEHQVPGRNYRLLSLDGRLIGCSERLPPMVVGDGRSTVRDLVAASNAVRRGNLPVLPMVLDRDARRMLRRQRLTPLSVPRRGRRVRIHEVTNISKGGRCREVRAEAHPGWAEIARRLRRAIPGSRLLGADVIAQNIARAPFDAAQGKPAQRWWIIEVNSTPEIELHHFPWEGQPSDPASAIVRALFAPSSHSARHLHRDEARIS